MEKDLKMLEKLYDLRYKSGKVHLFYSVNKIMGRLGEAVKLDRIYISKDYVGYLSEKMFADSNKLLGFFAGTNKFIRLSLVDEFAKDFGKDICKEIKEDFLELKKYNSSVFSDMKARLETLLNEKEREITNEDLTIFENYLSNWKSLESKLRAFIPEEFYEKKNNYFYTALISYTKFFNKYSENYDMFNNYLKK